MFDDSIDLVVWGHEHDCRIVPEPVAGKNYYVTQPGSSVATSLADGEAIEKSILFASTSHSGVSDNHTKTCSSPPSSRQGIQDDSYQAAHCPPFCDRGALPG